MIALAATRDLTAQSNQQRGCAMNSKSKITLAVIGVTFGLLVTPFAASADDVPDALSVERQGKKPCEKLFEDAQVRVARCTFPPGVVHVCHSHPAYLSYVLSGGLGQVQDEKGTRKVDVVTGVLFDIPPTPWHEFANIGGTTVQYLIVEKKYQPASPVSQTVCPKGTSK
jgi:quercetin dioxygenase-like cupin family protein